MTFERDQKVVSASAAEGRSSERSSLVDGCACKHDCHGAKENGAGHGAQVAAPKKMLYRAIRNMTQLNAIADPAKRTKQYIP
jgi:hypothetical protein